MPLLDTNEALCEYGVCRAPATRICFAANFPDPMGACEVHARVMHGNLSEPSKIKPGSYWRWNGAGYGVISEEQYRAEKK